MVSILRLVKLVCITVLVGSLLACGEENVEDQSNDSESYCGGSTGDAQGISISWDAPTKFTDDSDLLFSEIQAYKIYIGDQSGNYTNTISVNDPTANTCSVPVSTTGTYFITMTVVLNDGRESNYSNEITRTI